MKRVFIPAILAWILVEAGCSEAAPPSDVEAKGTRALEEKLNSLTLPKEPDFGGVSLEEALEPLQVWSREADVPGAKGINFVMINRTDNLLPKLPGLKFKNVSFGEALRHVTELTGMKYRVDTHAIAIGTAEHFKLKRPQLTEADAPTEREKRLLRSLKHHLRPTITFQDTTVEEAVEFLRTSHGCLDIGDREWPAKREPMNIVIKVRPNSTQPLITLDLKDTPIAEAIFYIAEMSGLKLSLRSSSVVLSDQESNAPVRAATRAPGSLETSAAEMILPKVELWGASLGQALDFMRAQSRELDPAKKGIDIHVTPGDDDNTALNLTLKAVPWIDALDHIAELSGHRLSVEGGLLS